MNEFISGLQSQVTSGNLWDAIVAVAPLIGALIIFVFGLITVGRLIYGIYDATGGFGTYKGK